MGGNGAAASRYRPALDGLRAVAVVAVILYHLDFAWIPGGFLGVDLFFVLSGYLITGILLEERSRTGRIDLGRFWTRRVRRLLPAFALVSIAVSLHAWATADPVTLFTIRGDSFAAIFYGANWWFIHKGSSYFDEFASPSPLRHTWSLAIEEQFYLVWPAFVGLFLRMGRGRDALLRGVSVALLVGSLVWLSALYRVEDPSVAYFHTGGRVHELLVGALLAAVMRRRASAALSRIAAAGQVPAFLALCALFVFVHDTSPRYFRGGSFAASLLIAGLIASVDLVPGGSLARLLSRPPIVLVGKISYGLYLWHWPMRLWITERFVPVPLVQVSRVVATIAVSWLSFRFVEMPTREGSLGKWLVPRRLTVVLPSVLLLLAGTVAVATTGAEPPPDFVNDGSPIVVTEGSLSGTGPLIALAGDSVAKSLSSAFVEAARERGWRIVTATFGGCALSERPDVLHVRRNGTPFGYSRTCRDRVPGLQAQLVADYNPTVVVAYSGRELNDVVRADGTRLRVGTPAHWRDVVAALDTARQRLTRRGALLLLIEPIPPAQPSSGVCADPDASADPCIELRERRTWYLEYIDAVQTWAAHAPNVRLMSIADEGCPGGPPCAVDRLPDGTVLRPDGFHFEDVSAQRFVARLVAMRVAEILRSLRS